MKCIGLTDEAYMPPNPIPETSTTAAPRRKRGEKTTSAAPSIAEERKLQEEITNTLLPLDDEIWSTVIIDDNLQL